MCVCAGVGLGVSWGWGLFPYVKGWKSYDIFPFAQNGSLTYLPDAELDTPLY